MIPLLYRLSYPAIYPQSGQNIPKIPLKSKQTVDIRPANGYVRGNGVIRAMEHSANVRAAYNYCETVARAHYENFPVASLMLPKKKRPFVAAIYAYARAADDIADEGGRSPEERLRQLDAWEASLDACYRGTAEHPVFVALADTVRRHRIPRKPLSDLLTAFRMDITQSRFPAFDSLLRYCTCSANPIGQLVLYIFGDANPQTIPLSDAICTALQLTNFWQDVSVDWQKGRLYLPLEDLERFGYTERALAEHVVDDRFRNLMRIQVERTRRLFEAGAPLRELSDPGLRRELRITVAGGLQLLKKIEGQNYDVLTRRPALSGLEKATLFLKAGFVKNL
jgi:squalene synthase HpnC